MCYSCSHDVKVLLMNAGVKVVHLRHNKHKITSKSYLHDNLLHQSGNYVKCNISYFLVCGV